MLTWKWMRAFGPIVLGWVVVAGAAFGQSERGAITGTVHDESGAVIAGAKVTVTEIATGTTLSLASNDSGDYTGPNLSVGVYSVRVEKEGFRAATMSGVVLNTGATARADFTLQVGAATQSVEVQAQAVTLSTDSATTSATVVNKLVDELPLVVSGRAVNLLAKVIPSVQTAADFSSVMAAMRDLGVLPNSGAPTPIGAQQAARRA